MDLLLISLLAGVLTVLSPCILPLLPVVVAGSVSEKNKKAPLVIIASLAISVIAFTLLIRASTAFIGVPSSFWLVFSGLLIVFIGVTFAFPAVWEKISLKLGLQQKANSLTAASSNKTGLTRNILLGASLGPIFTSCSPTYGIILATVLPTSFAFGFINLLAYTIGLSAVLLAIAIGGQRTTKRLEWASKPNSPLRRILGIILIIVGILIVTGLIKDIEAWMVQAGIDSTRLELQFLNLD